MTLTYLVFYFCFFYKERENNDFTFFSNSHTKISVSVHCVFGLCEKDFNLTFKDVLIIKSAGPA